jgi:hypothetical protein
MLRALAAVDAKQTSEETVAAAARVAPLPVMTPGPGSQAGLNAMTPRRVGVTPRRTGTLGAGTTPRSAAQTRTAVAE